MDGRIFESLANGFIFLACVCAVAVPLAVWKAVEIVMWTFSHVHFS